MLSRFDFITEARVRGKPAIVAAALLTALVLSLVLFLLLGNGKVSRVLFFPSARGGKLVAEQRLLPRHRSRDAEVRELADEVLLGPMRHDLDRLFPRGVTVRSLVLDGRTLYLDLTPRAALPDAEVPLAGQQALDALARSLRANFPWLRELVVTIDGQSPEPPEKRKI